jgi:hypothetical protein
MDLIGGWLLPVTWTLLGLTIVVGALRAHRSDRAFTVAIGAVSVLWVVAGAAANAAMLIDGNTYTDFAQGSPIRFVRDTWESVVVPDHHLFIGILIAAEALAGLMVLVPGRPREVALIALTAFNATLIVFGWSFAIWAVPLMAALMLLHRAERLRNPRRRPSAGASSDPRHRSPRSRVPSP